MSIFKDDSFLNSIDFKNIDFKQIPLEMYLKILLKLKEFYSKKIIYAINRPWDSNLHEFIYDTVEEELLKLMNNYKPESPASFTTYAYLRMKVGVFHTVQKESMKLNKTKTLPCEEVFKIIEHEHFHDMFPTISNDLPNPLDELEEEEKRIIYQHAISMAKAEMPREFEIFERLVFKKGSSNDICEDYNFSSTTCYRIKKTVLLQIKDNVNKCSRSKKHRFIINHLHNKNNKPSNT